MLNHGMIEKSAALMILLTLVTISIGGLVQIVPLFKIENTIEPVKGVRPYSPLELMGRKIYMDEGCYGCHSQMIRPFRNEVDRYGHYSLAAESMYDYPFLWGSKRTGPDLARIGGKYSNQWQTAHLTDPRSVQPASIMPPYGFLRKERFDMSEVRETMRTMQRLGVPYTDQDIKDADKDIVSQAEPGKGDPAALRKRYHGAALGPFTGPEKHINKMDALIAYLQVLGTEVNFASFDPDTMTQGQGD